MKRVITVKIRIKASQKFIGGGRNFADFKVYDSDVTWNSARVLLNNLINEVIEDYKDSLDEMEDMTPEIFNWNVRHFEKALNNADFDIQIKTVDE